VLPAFAADAQALLSALQQRGQQAVAENGDRGD
jgi:hypothetical protein